MQETFLSNYALPLNACRSFRLAGGDTSKSAVDAYQDNFQSIQNLFCQLNSIHQVTALWQRTRREYHAVLYLRPDVLFNCPLPIDVLDNVVNGTMYVPDFHHFGGLNDRFLMAKPHVAANWGNRWVLFCPSPATGTCPYTMMCSIACATSRATRANDSVW
jgi:hypothetical protein